jgi:RNA polymerase sigma-70 factor (ECF subfamily)
MRGRNLHFFPEEITLNVSAATRVYKSVKRNLRHVGSAELEEWTLTIIRTERDPDPQPEAAGEVPLLSLAKSGDIGAFRQIVLLHQRQVLGTALRMLGRLDLAEDAAQETFLRVFKHLQRFDERHEFSPWLYQIVINVCRDMNRKSRKEPVLSLEDLQTKGGSLLVIDRSDLEANLDVARQRGLVRESLKILSEREREALVLRDLEGLSTQEVATILGSSEGTVRSQISSARVKIKRFVEKRMRKQT